MTAKLSESSPQAISPADCLPLIFFLFGENQLFFFELGIYSRDLRDHPIFIPADLTQLFVKRICAEIDRPQFAVAAEQELFPFLKPIFQLTKLRCIASFHLSPRGLACLKKNFLFLQ